MSLFDEDPDDFIESLESAAPESGGLPEPRFTAAVIGHGAVEEQLAGFINAGKMPHAMLFAGLQGIGKASMAFRLAKFLLTHKAEEGGDSLFGVVGPAAVTTLDSRSEDAAVRLVHSGGHPDLLVLEREYDEAKGKTKDSLSVEQVRKVAPFLQLTPFMGGWRIVIIDDADTMTRSSQNAILKILEEPPANALLVLIAHRPGLMIPTIRSRCRTIDFSTPSRADFKVLLGSAAAGQGDALYNISGGSIGAARRLMETGALKALEQVTKLLSPWPKLDGVEIHLMAELLGGKGNEAEALQGFQDTLLWICGQMARARATGAPLPVPIQDAPFPAMLAGTDLAGWSEICDSLNGHFAMVKYGTLDKRQAVLGAFSILKDRA